MNKDVHASYKSIKSGIISGFTPAFIQRKKSNIIHIGHIINKDDDEC